MSSSPAEENLAPCGSNSSLPGPAEVEQLRIAIAATLTESLSRSNAAFRELVAMIQAHDEQYHASEKAAAFLKPALDFVRLKLDAVNSTLESLNISVSPLHPVDSTISVAQAGLAGASAALLAVKNTVHEYDEKHQLSVTLWSRVATPRDTITAAVADAATGLSNIQSRILMLREEMRNTSSSFVASARDAAISYANTGLLKAHDVAVAMDSKYGVTQKVLDLNEQYSIASKAGTVVERAAAIDNKVTGGLGTRVVQKGLEIASQGLGYVQGLKHDTAAPVAPAGEASDPVVSSVN